jgi:hypothetical protein
MVDRDRPAAVSGLPKFSDGRTVDRECRGGRRRSSEVL